jgi:hypothetical protein
MSGEVHAFDLESIAERGTYGGDLTTRLASEADAQRRADEIVARQSTPAWILAGVAVELAFVLSPSDTRQVLALDVHSLIRVTDLPVEGPAQEALLWVEGWQETIEPDSWSIAFATSDYCRSAGSAYWDDVPAAQTWDTTDPSLTWNSAVCLVPPAGGERWDATDPAVRWDTVEPDNVTWDSWG